jgi:L-fuconolactonase
MADEIPVQRPTIDAHHHLWHYTPDEYGWIDDTMQTLRRDFLPQDLAAAAASAGVTGTVAVQARQTLEETEWLLELAAAHPLIQGVVGWAPIASPDFPELISRLAANPHLKALRHVIQAEPDPNYILRPDFNRGIRALLPTRLTYDILILERHLPQTIDFVDRHPHQLFILDHIAKPRIAAAELHPWATRLCKLAERPNVLCKVSGLVTEAEWQSEAGISPETFKPYLDTVVAAFTPARLLAASDWPVCLVATTYPEWWQVLRAYFAPFTSSEQAAIFGGNATAAYKLEQIS